MDQEAVGILRRSLDLSSCRRIAKTSADLDTGPLLVDDRQARDVVVALSQLGGQRIQQSHLVEDPGRDPQSARLLTEHHQLIASVAYALAEIEVPLGNQPWQDLDAGGAFARLDAQDLDHVERI